MVSFEVLLYGVLHLVIITSFSFTYSQSKFINKLDLGLNKCILKNPKIYLYQLLVPYLIPTKRESNLKEHGIDKSNEKGYNHF